MAANSSKLKDVFISYGREPAVVQFVKQLKQDLEMSGFSLWLDVEDIKSGTDWRAEIGSGLDNSKAIIPIITQKYLGSRYCINELYSADGDQKLIFPIMFEDVDFTASDSAKGVKFVISGINWTMCRPGIDDYAMSLEKLIVSMREKGIGIVGAANKISADVASTSNPVPTAKDSPAYPLKPKSTKPIKTLLGFNNPNGLAVTRDNKLMVTDMDNKIIVFDENYERIGTIGEEGIGNGQFTCPQGMAIDCDDNIIVTAYAMHCVQKFSSDGKFLKAYGSPGKGEGQFQGPNGIAINHKNGNIYICDVANHRVQVLSKEMTYLFSFSTTDPNYGSGKLNNPSGVGINSDGHVFVTDMMNHCVQVFDQDGRYLTRISKQGSTSGCLISPMGLVIDRDDLIHVIDGVCRVSTFTKHGIFVRAFGSHGSELGKFGMPRGICIDNQERLYVCEWNNNRVQIFQ